MGNPDLGNERKCTMPTLEELPAQSDPNKMLPVTHSQQPSAVVGWIIGVAVAIPLMVILIIVTANPKPLWWITPIVAITMTVIAQTINRARRYKPQQDTVVTPIVQESTATVDQRMTAVDAVAKGAKRLAGHIEDDIFKVTSHEIAVILKRPHAFYNVLVAEESPEMMSINKGKWFLVLAKGQAVAFNQDVTQVWSIKPQDVTEKSIRSVDGRAENIAFEKICILAWQSYTWEQFCETAEAKEKKNPNKLPARWSLLVWSLSTGKDPSPWIPFKLPYNSIKEGIEQLCSSPEDLKTVVRFCGPKNIAKWIAKLAPEHIQAINPVLSAEAQTEATSYFRSGLIVIVFGIVLTFMLISSLIISFDVSLLSTSHWDAEAITVFLFMMSVGLLVVAIGIGLIIYSRHMLKWSQKDYQNTVSPRTLQT